MSARARAMKKAKYASGGKIDGVPVPGKAVIKEAESENEGFQKGGKVVPAKGLRSGGRADKPARKAAGGAVKPVKLARGGSPFSAAAKGGKMAPDSGDECA